MYSVYVGQRGLMSASFRSTVIFQNVKKFHKYCYGSNCISEKRTNFFIRANNINHKKYNFLPSNHFVKRNLSLPSMPGLGFFGLSKEPPAIQPDLETLVAPATDIASNAGFVDPYSIAEVASAPGITEVIGSAIVDPPFVEMGLATRWFPNHFVHQLLEWVHLTSDLPWWSTIIMGTVVIRLVTLPIFIYTRKYLIKSNNHRDELQLLMEKYNVAKNSDNMLKRVVAEQKLKDFYKATGTGPFKGLFVNVSMMALFMTCFTAVRQMCAVPVPSLTEGGVLWFTNLAAADPYHILPLVTGMAMGLTINTGMKGGTLQTGASYAGLIRKIRYLPVIAMPLLAGKVACGIYIYWLTTSIITLGITSAIQKPKVREALNFPVPIPPKQKEGGAVSVFTDWRKESSEKVRIKMLKNEMNRRQKTREKERKKELKRAPPVTYTIGVEAKPKIAQKPDFEMEWRPPRPDA